VSPVGKGLEVVDGFLVQTRWELVAEGVGVPLGSVSGSRVVTSPINKRAGGPQPHRQRCRMMLEYHLNEGQRSGRAQLPFFITGLS